MPDEPRAGRDPIADLRRIAFLLEAAMEPGYRVRAFRGAAETLTTIGPDELRRRAESGSLRELSGIGFPGAPYEHVFFVADTEATGSMVPDEVNVYLWREGFHLLFPMRGQDHWRIVGILPPDLRDAGDVPFEAVVPSLRQEAGADLSFKTCSWFSTYRIHHRSAARFRRRRPPRTPRALGGA